MPNAQTSSSIRLEIQKIKNLPPLPMVAQQLLGRVDNEDASIESIVEVLHQEPTLASRILGLANSAFFGFGRKVLCLEEAIINVLGLDMVRGLALSIVMGGAFDLKKCREFDLAHYWSSALMTAELAKRLSLLMPARIRPAGDQLYLYGLLHNIGVLILVDRFPKLMSEIFTVAKQHPDRRLIHTEQSMLDTDHHLAGAWLAHKWRLPDEIITVIEYHHDTGYSDSYCHETLLTGYCSRVSRNWLLGSDVVLPGESDTTLPQLGIDKAAVQLSLKKCFARFDELSGVAAQMAN